MTGLAERQESYELLYDTKIVPTVPVIIKSSIRNYESVIQKLQKPFSEDLSEILKKTLLHTVTEIDGAIFAYSFAGEFIIILRNDLDQNSAPFYKNKVQDVSSITSSILTSAFNKLYLAADEQPDLIGDVIFKTKTFCVPSISEAMNYLLYKQQTCSYYSVTSATYHELNKNFNHDYIKKVLESKSVSDKKSLLETQCGVYFDDYYSTTFRRGFACYKAPKMVKSQNEEFTKTKWMIDNNIPDFISGREFILNILHNGQDILFPDRDLI